jgi:hypothetical protein
MLVLVGALAIGAGALGACGGKVVVDSGGNGGEGGVGTTNTTNTTTNGTSTASTASGGGAMSLCTQACAALDQVPGCSDGSECTEGCLDEWSKGGPCADLFLVAVACVIDNAGVGGICTSDVCVPLANDYENCVTGGGNGCTGGDCAGSSDGTCQCSGSCNGNAVEASCFADPGQTSTCLCKVNGIEIGKCQSSFGTFPCDIEVGCCAEFF